MAGQRVNGIPDRMLFHIFHYNLQDNNYLHCVPLQDNELMAYQIAFDLYESGSQLLLSELIQTIGVTAPRTSLIKKEIFEAKKDKSRPADEEAAEKKEEEPMEADDGAPKADGDGDVKMEEEADKKKEEKKEEDSAESTQQIIDSMVRILRKWIYHTVSCHTFFELLLIIKLIMLL